MGTNLEVFQLKDVLRQWSEIHWKVETCSDLFCNIDKNYILFAFLVLIALIKTWYFEYFLVFVLFFFYYLNGNLLKWNEWSAYCCVSWFLGTISYLFVGGIGTKIWQSYFSALCWKKNLIISHVIYWTSTILPGITGALGFDLPLV